MAQLDLHTKHVPKLGAPRRQKWERFARMAVFTRVLYVPLVCARAWTLECWWRIQKQLPSWPVVVVAVRSNRHIHIYLGMYTTMFLCAVHRDETMQNRYGWGQHFQVSRTDSSTVTVCEWLPGKICALEGCLNRSQHYSGCCRFTFSLYTIYIFQIVSRIVNENRKGLSAWNQIRTVTLTAT